MKNSIRLLIIMILIILGIVMTIVAFGMSTVVNKDAISEKNRQDVIEKFTELTVITGNNNDIRNELIGKLDLYTNETYPQEHEKYLELLNKYQENYKTIMQYTNDIEKKCKKNYEDSRVNIMCKSYRMLYEESTNTYVMIFTKYNNNIKNYNQTATTPYSEFEMIQKEYIDYNQDNIFLGKPEEDNVQ